ncbi:MAG: hypothetical protein V2A61_02120 [Calditrichota bacterium]
MSRHIFLILMGILFVVIIEFAFRWLDRSTDELAEVTSKHIEEVSPEQISIPDVVAVTFGDSLFHDPSCAWVGSDSRRMSRKAAIEKFFQPCPQCVGGE